MARYLVLEFEDDESAEKLRLQVEERQRAGARMRVVGLFARPKAVCRCISDPSNYDRSPVARGARFGWNTCMACKRAKKGAHACRNLLEAVDTLPPVTLIDSDSSFARGYEYRVDNLHIYEVPTDNIKRGD